MKFMIVCLAIAGVASAAQFNPYVQQQQLLRTTGEAQAPVLRSDSSINPDGSYSYTYETGNGISASESGVGGVRAQGAASWTAPDGTPIQLTYIADENGYQPVGAHLPTPPPTPEHVLRALAWIQSHPQTEGKTVYRPISAPQFRQVPTQRPFFQNPAFSAYRRQ